MAITLQQLTAVLYLIAGALGAAGLALRQPGITRGGVWCLGVGALVHGVSFSLLHRLDPPPPLTHLPAAVSFMAWVGTTAFLVLAWRARLTGLVVLVAPVAFLSVFAALLALPAVPVDPLLGAGSLPHAHVLLASSGLALLGLACMAGLLFLAEHRRLKNKRPMASSWAWPSLEALDRAGAFAVAVGFPLLTLGVLTGALWLHAARDLWFSGSAHETFSLVAWGIYGVLVSQRFGAGQPARRCALSSVAGFGVLALTVVGVEWLA